MPPPFCNDLLNDTITVDVKINTTDEVYAFDFSLLYDSSVLEYMEAAEGDFLGSAAVLGVTFIAMLAVVALLEAL